LKRLYSDFGALLAMALVLSATAFGQSNQAPPRPATVTGTVTDVNGDAVPNATVVLKEIESNDPRTIVTTENGMFEFHDVTPGITFQLSVRAADFADWTSPPIMLDPGQFKIVSGIRLRIATERTSVDVHYDPVEVATEQFKAEEKQRVFGIFPNLLLPLSTYSCLQGQCHGPQNFLLLPSTSERSVDVHERLRLGKNPASFY